MKGNGAQIADVGVMVATDRQRASHAPFGAPGLRSSFSKERVAIESQDGRVVQELLWIRSQQLRSNRHGSRLLDVAHEHAAQAELDSRPPGQLRLPGEQTLGHLASHGAEAYEPNVQ